MLAWPRGVDTPRGAVQIAPATPTDASAVLALRRRVIEEGEWFVSEAGEWADTLEAQVASLRALAAAGNSVGLVARHRFRVVGWLQLMGGAPRRLRHVARLEILLDADWRGVGLGAALMEAGLAWAAASGEVEKVSLAVYAHNARAVALYKKFGFEEEGRRIGEYRFPDGTLRDDLLMARWVTPRPPR